MVRQTGPAVEDIELDALFRAHGPDLERYLRRRLPSPDAAADFAQEAFLRLARQRRLSEAAGDSVRHLRAYLFRIAKHLVADHYRSGPGLTATSLEAALDQADPTPTAAAVIEAREELSILRDAIQALPPRGQEVFLMHKFEGLSYAEIALRLGISKNTVMVHMMRSLSACARRLEAHRRAAPPPLSR